MQTMQVPVQFDFAPLNPVLHPTRREKEQAKVNRAMLLVTL
jgi:hypothetical protein